LPGILHTNLDNLPADIPYLTAKTPLVDKWNERLRGIEGFQVGIAWQGNPEYAHDRRRSIPLRHFEPLSTVPGVRLISLQKGYGSEQLAAVAGRFDVLDVAAELDDFVDTAAVMKNQAMVITSDTAVAHLAGALGIPVWLALHDVPDWRWFLGRENSPWYPSMRLFRQLQPGDWPELFARMAAALARIV
jgi:hypothetical protein